MTTQKEGAAGSASTQPQEALPGALAEAGAPGAGQAPQAGAKAEGDRAGAGKAEGRTYTQKEWSARESAKDKEIARMRGHLVALATARQQESAQNSESVAKAADLRAVEDGEITQAEVAARQQRRADEGKTRQDLAQTKGALDRMYAEAYVVGKALLAQDLAKELGIDAATLIKDESITNQQEMRVKARELALEKRETALKGNESYDKGPAGSRAWGTKGYADKLRSGEELPSAAEIDRITARYANMK